MGQCCGGQVDLLFEVIGKDQRATVAAHEMEGGFTTTARINDRGVERAVTDETLPAGIASFDHGTLREGFGEDRRPLLLFGAGHVGRALALAPLPFSVTWVDPRPDAFPAYVPANVTLSRLDDPVAAFAGAPAGTLVLVMSHSHQLDLALIHAAFDDVRFPYVGLHHAPVKAPQVTLELSSCSRDLEGATNPASRWRYSCFSRSRRHIAILPGSLAAMSDYG